MTLVTKKHPCPLHAVFTTCFVFEGLRRPCHNFNCYINEREIPKTCLTNHKGSISHHIMPLVINSLRGRHTHTHIYSHRRQKQFHETSCVLAFGQHAPSLTSTHHIHYYWSALYCYRHMYIHTYIRMYDYLVI